MRPAGAAAGRRAAQDGTRGPVVVCGAGAAGLAAALAAASEGRAVYLIEAAPRIGGTVTHALIHTLGGLFDAAGGFLNGGLARDLARDLMAKDAAAQPRRIGRCRVLSVCPATYRDVAESWLTQEPRITLLTRAKVQRLLLRDGGICTLAVATATGHTLELRPRAVIDATGSGAIARLVRADLVEDRQAPAAGGVIFRMRGVARGALAFPKGLGLVRAVHAAAAAGALPPGCGRAWLDQGVRDDEVYVKLLVALAPAWQPGGDDRQIMAQAAAEQAAIVAFLHGRDDFREAVVVATGSLGVRDGGCVRGEYRLSVADVRAARKFPDAACRCAWPIEFWDPARGVTLEYLPDEADFYEIPLRSLKVRAVANFWTAGKSLCADALAQASARVAGTCWAMGEAAGRAAARA